jgi:hypothetical protein
MVVTHGSRRANRIRPTGLFPLIPAGLASRVTSESRHKFMIAMPFGCNPFFIFVT